MSFPFARPMENVLPIARVVCQLRPVGSVIVIIAFNVIVIVMGKL